MSDAGGEAPSQTPRLDASALDDIVEDMELATSPTPSIAERIDRWYRDLREDVWNWLKRETGGDEGPLAALERGLERFLEDGLGVEANGAVASVLEWGSVLVLAIGLAWLVQRLVRYYLPAQRQRQAMTFFGDASLAKPLEQLPREKWVPALFTHVCLELAQTGRLQLMPSNTNRTLAANAELPAALGAELRRLAQAADRVQFANWQPQSQEFESLLQARTTLLAALADSPA